MKSRQEWLQIVVFMGCYAVLHSLYFQLPDDVLREQIYHRGFGQFCSELIQLAAPEEGVAAVGNHLLSSKADLEIVRGCDGAGALFLIVAAIVAFPATIKRKAVGLALGIALMYSLNIIRISGLYFVVAYYRDWFQLIHTYLAPTLIIALGSLYFAWWAFGSAPKPHGSR